MFRLVVALLSSAVMARQLQDLQDLRVPQVQRVPRVRRGLSERQVPQALKASREQQVPRAALVRMAQLVQRDHKGCKVLLVRQGHRARILQCQVQLAPRVLREAASFQQPQLLHPITQNQVMHGLTLQVGRYMFTTMDSG